MIFFIIHGTIRSENNPFNTNLTDKTHILTTIIYLLSQVPLLKIRSRN